jgi:hypothetical protein
MSGYHRPPDLFDTATRLCVGQPYVCFYVVEPDVLPAEAAHALALEACPFDSTTAVTLWACAARPLITAYRAIAHCAEQWWDAPAPCLEWQVALRATVPDHVVFYCPFPDIAFDAPCWHDYKNLLRVAGPPLPPALYSSYRPLGALATLTSSDRDVHWNLAMARVALQRLQAEGQPRGFPYKMQQYMKAKTLTFPDDVRVQHIARTRAGAIIRRDLAMGRWKGRSPPEMFACWLTRVAAEGDAWVQDVVDNWLMQIDDYRLSTHSRQRCKLGVALRGFDQCLDFGVGVTVDQLFVRQVQKAVQLQRHGCLRCKRHAVY